METDLVAVWRKIIIGENKSWVLFRNGTCVILMEPEADLEQQAIALMKEWGPVHVATSAGDFSVAKLTGHPGWAVRGHHRDILNYVAPEEVPATDGPQDAIVGLIGRSKRDEDAHELQIIHIEDKRSPP